MFAQLIRHALRKPARRRGLFVERLEDRVNPVRSISPDSVLAAVIDPVGPVNVANPGLSPFEQLGLRANRVTPLGSGIVQINTNGLDPESLVAQLQATPGIAWASPNYVYGVATELTANDSKYSQQTSLPVMHVPNAWDTLVAAGKPLGNAGTIVAVIDEGVDVGHADIVSAIATNFAEVDNGLDDDGNGYIDDLIGWDFTGAGDNAPLPSTGKTHGNEITGVIAARSNNLLNIAGIAGGYYDVENEVNNGGARILPIRVIDGSNNLTSAGLAAALNYAASRFVRIANMSFDLDQFAADSAVQAAMTNAYDAGTLLIASAGNTGAVDPARKAFDQVLFVGGTNNSDKLSRVAIGSPYDSNYGSFVDIMAPSEGIWTLGKPSQSLQVSGTSLAAPAVAGTAALLLAQNPSYTRDQLAAKLLGTAVNIDALNPGYDGMLGSGRVDALAALTGTLAEPTITDFKVNGVSIQDGSTVNGISTITLTVPRRLNPESVNSGSFELRSDGPDNLFGTIDDSIVPLSLKNPYRMGDTSIDLTTISQIPGDHYRLVIKNGIDGLRDPFDGLLAGNLQLSFSVTASTRIANDIKANSLALSEASNNSAYFSDGGFVTTWIGYGVNGNQYAPFVRLFDSNYLPNGPDYMLYEPLTDLQRQTSVAVLQDDSFVVAWESYSDGSGKAVTYQHFNRNGTPRTGVRIANSYTNSDQFMPIVFRTGTGFTISYASRTQDGGGTNIYQRRFGVNGLPTGPETRVTQGLYTNDTANNTQIFAASNSNGDYLVAANIMDVDGGGNLLGIIARAFNSSGIPYADEFLVNQYQPGHQAVNSVSALPDGTFFVGYGSHGNGGPGYESYIRRFSTTGAALSNEIWTNTSTNGDQGGPTVALLPNGGFEVIWESNHAGNLDLYRQEFSAAYQKVGAESRVNADATGTQFICRFAIDALGHTTNKLLTFTDDNDISFQKMLSTTTVAMLRPANDNNFINDNERVVQSVSSFVVGFTTPLIPSASSAANWQLTIDGLDKSSTISSISYNSIPASNGLYEITLALSAPILTGNVQLRAKDTIQDLNGNALDGDANGTFGGDFVRSFTVANIGPIGSQSAVNTSNTAAKVATLPNGGYLSIWGGSGSGDDPGIFGRFLTSSLNVLGSQEFRINQETNDIQNNPAFGVDSLGNFVVTWQSFGQDGSDYGIFARRYNASGTPLDDEFLVNVTTNGDQAVPDIAVSKNGDFVITWYGPATPGSDPQIYHRRYSANGTALGGEIKTSTFATTGGGQQYPSIACDLSGNYVIAWGDAAQEGVGNGLGCYGRLFRADGTPQGSDFHINITIANNQYYPSVAMADDGNFVVMWESMNQDGSGRGVFGRLFNSAAVPRSNELSLATITDGDQQSPSVDMDADGDFVAVWGGSDAMAVGPSDVMWRRFNSSGVPQSTSEIRFPSYLTGGQYVRQVAVNSQGDGVVIWRGTGVSDNSGTFIQRFAGNDALTTSGIPTQTILEDAAAFPVDLTGKFTDPNNPTPSFTYSVVNNTNAGLFSSLNFAGNTMTITPAANAIGSAVVTVRAEITGGLFVDAPFAVIVQPVNDPPTFVKGNNLVNVVNAVPQTIPNWATAISGGPGETDTVSFEIVSNSNPSLFSTAPAISTSGTLTYAPAVSEYGAAVIQVRAKDNGGTANGGSDTSATQTFVITVNPQNPNNRQFGSQSVANSAANGGITALDQTLADIASNAKGQRVAVWSSEETAGGATDVYAQIYSAGGTPVGGNFLVNQTTAAYQYFPKTAIDPDGNVWVTWSSGNGITYDYDVKIRKFNEFGVPLTDEITANVVTANAQFLSDIAVDDAGQPLVVWTSSQLQGGAANTGQDGEGAGVYYRRFTASGTPVNVMDVQAHTQAAGDQMWPRVSMTPGGSFVLAWGDANGAGRIVARTFPAVGSASSEITVSTGFDYPVVATDATGGFVVTWTSLDIYARRYDATGTSLGAAFLVNSSHTANLQWEATAAMDADGDFVIAWEGDGPGDSQGAFFQSYARTGSAVGTLTRVNASATGSQFQPAVAMDADGDAVFAWSDGDIAIRRHGYPEPTGLSNAPIVNDSDGELDLNALFTNNSGPQEALGFTLGGITNSGILNKATVTANTLRTEFKPGVYGSAEIGIQIADTTEGLNGDGKLVIRKLQDANASPVLDFIRDRSVNEGSTITITAFAIDKTGGTPLVYTMPEKASGATIDSATGVLAWTPGDSQVADFTVVVTDPNNNFFTQESFKINVLNVAPTATFSGPAVVAPNATPTFSFTGTADASAVDAASLRFAYDYNNDGVWDAGGATYATAIANASKTAPATFFSTAGSTRTVRGRVIDKDNGFTDYFVSVNVENVGPSVGVPTATIEVNDGGTQRSNVRSLTVEFNQAVTFPAGLAAAFSLTRSGPGSPAGAVPLAFNLVGNMMTITFVAGSFTSTTVAEPSLIDGNYTLTLVAANIQSPGGLLNNGVDQTLNFKRLFGDGDGNANVNADDFALFGNGFGASFGGANYNTAFDANLDGIIDADDFAQFGNRFGVTL